MVGVDLHDAIVPPNLTKKIPSLPHVVAAPLRGGAQTLFGVGYAGSVLHAPRVRARGADALQRSTDIGVAIPHVQVNLLVPVIMADSKSKSLFGAGTVRAQGRPVATAVFATWNLNLNCGDPIRLPSGYVDAPNTVRAGMTEGDLFAGLVEMIFDVVYGFLKSKGLVDKLLLPALYRLFPAALVRLLTSNPLFKAFFDKLLKIPLGKGVDVGKPGAGVWDQLADLYDDPKHRVFL